MTNNRAGLHQVPLCRINSFRVDVLPSHNPRDNLCDNLCDLHRQLSESVSCYVPSYPTRVLPLKVDPLCANFLSVSPHTYSSCCGPVCTTRLGLSQTLLNKPVSAFPQDHCLSSAYRGPQHPAFLLGLPLPRLLCLRHL